MAQRNFSSSSIFLTLQKLRQLVSNTSTQTGSLSVYSPSRILQQLHHWNKALPTITPYYAVKCNPESHILETLANQSVNFDCASLREISEVKKLGWPEVSRYPTILYAHPLKSQRDIQSAKVYGIERTVVDSVEECIKLKENDWKGDALLRVAVSDAGSKMPFSVKFGASKEEVIKICRDSTIPLSGVSFHVGSGCEDVTQYAQAIQYASSFVFDTLKKYKHTPKILDIGGGYSANQIEFQKAASVIRTALNTVPEGTTVIAEPGRYFAHTSHDLLVQVIAKKPGVNGVGWRYIIDESVYSQFSCIPFDHQQPPWFRIPKTDTDTYRPMDESILFGRTCDSLDVIAKGQIERLEVGDWLYFPFMGAYTSSTASEFNGFPKPKMIEDTNSLLPNSGQVWEWIDQFHKFSKVTYTNALPPII